MKAPSSPPLPLAAAVGLLAILIWAASPAATVIAAAGIPPSLVGMLRTVLAAALLLPVAVIADGGFPPTSPAGWCWH